MRQKIVKTKDGSHTLYVPELDENYHSVNGAIQESVHVFINAGFKQIHKKQLHIFEVGFGTGLNALLTYLQAIKSNRKVIYHAIEKYPLTIKQIHALNYPDFIGNEVKDVFIRFHETPWEKEIIISEFFTLKKIKADLKSYIFSSEYDLIYFDAFAPDIQPGMWQENVFGKIYEAMAPGAVLTTYSVKGSIKRTMVKVGLKVEKLPGPPGKREMLRAIKV